MPARVSVRTVQLWETDRNLPVRRLPRYPQSKSTPGGRFSRPTPLHHHTFENGRIHRNSAYNTVSPAARSRVDCRRNFIPTPRKTSREVPIPEQTGTPACK